LLLQVWGAEYLDRPHYLRVHMANLRQKLEQDPAQPAHLVTELQVGYRLVGLAADCPYNPSSSEERCSVPQSRHRGAQRGVRLGFHPATTLTHAFCAVRRYFPFCCRTWFFIQFWRKP
jgi:DNA-binding winged helix-turn-helix (wHTH) protein